MTKEERNRKRVNLNPRARVLGESQRGGKKKRNCLRCENPFMSFWIGNRICKGCMSFVTQHGSQDGSFARFSDESNTGKRTGAKTRSGN